MISKGNKLTGNGMNSVYKNPCFPVVVVLAVCSCVFRLVVLRADKTLSQSRKRVFFLRREGELNGNRKCNHPLLVNNKAIKYSEIVKEILNLLQNM